MHVIGVIITHILQCMWMINKTDYLKIDSRIYVNLKNIIKLKSNLKKKKKTHMKNILNDFLLHKFKGHNLLDFQF